MAISDFYNITKDEIKSWITEDKVLEDLIEFGLIEDLGFQQLELDLFEKGIKYVETDYRDVKKENYEIEIATKQTTSNSKCIIKEIGKYQKSLTDDNFVTETKQAIGLKNDKEIYYEAS